MSPIDESALRHYTSVLLRVVGTHNIMHAWSLVFAFCGGPPSIDPYVEVFTRRLLILRRIWIKMPAARATIVKLFQHYQSHCALGASRHDLDVDCRIPAPLPGGDRRGDRRWPQTAQGPIAIALENVRWMAATLDLPSFTVSAKFDHDIHLMSDPCHHVCAALSTLASRVVHSLVAPDRTVLRDCPAIDAQIYKEAAKSLEPDQRGAVFGISILSIADQAY